MSSDRPTGQLETARFRAAHAGSVFVQPLFGQEEAVQWPAQLNYAPCWAILEPGMAVEPHRHPSAEVYVFVEGAGTMLLADESFAVASGMAIYIRPDALHSVRNEPDAMARLVWVSLGWHHEPAATPVSQEQNR